MYKKLLFVVSVLSIILLSFFAISCPIGSELIRVGSLSLEMEGDVARTIQPSGELVTVTSYRVSGTGPSGRILSPFNSTTSPITIEDLIEGSWTITVEGLNFNGDPLASKTLIVSIIAGEQTSAIFDLQWLVGFGNLNVTVTWPTNVTSFLRIQGILSQGETEIETFDLMVSDANIIEDQMSITHNIIGLATGSYDFVLTFHEENGNQVGLPYMDQVNIHNGITSSGSCVIGEVLLPIEAPVITPSGGRVPIGQEVIISSASPGVSIYYTVDGTTPNSSSLLYTDSFLLDKNTTVKAIAMAPTRFTSNVTSAVFEVAATNPEFSVDGGIYEEPITISMNCSTEEAVIHYTLDGTDPTQASATYSSVLAINENTTIKAIAIHPENSYSDIIEKSYGIMAGKPQLSLDEGTTYASPATLFISSQTPGAIIQYTLDGSDPTESGHIYDETGIVLTESTTIKAISQKSNMEDSSIVETFLTVLPVVESVQSNWESRLYLEPQEVELHTQTNDAEIRYTLDTSTPTAESLLYQGPILVNENTTIRAFAVKNGCISSDELCLDIKIQVAPPIFTPEPNTYTSEQTVSLHSSTEGAIIRYTLDGIDPTSTSMVFDPNDPLVISNDTTIKAFSSKENMEPSQIIEESYIIEKGSSGLQIVNPANHEVQINIPSEWEDTPIVSYSEGSVHAALSPLPVEEEAVSYRWYLDGLIAKNNAGQIASEGTAIHFGSDPSAITLEPGPHAIVVKATVDNMTYSNQVLISASFVERQYNVIFNPNEGKTPSFLQKTVITTHPYGELPTVNREGYIFAGWFLDPDEMNEEVTPQTVVELQEETMLYAHWEVLKIQVTFDAQSGSIPLDQSQKEVDAYTPYGQLPIAQRDGFSFNGWFSEPQGNGEKILATDTVQRIENHVLYAHWIAPAVVTFVVDGGENLSFSQKSVLIGQPYGEFPEGHKTGHALIGWWLTSDHQGDVIEENTIVETSQNHTLYGYYSPFFYVVKFNPEGGTVGTTSKTVTYGTQYGELPVPTREGYTFNGWWTSSNSNGGKIASTDIFDIAGLQTLYAGWTPLTYTISFDAGESDTLSYETKLITHGTDYGSLPTTTRAGYLFQGWYSDEALTNQVLSSDQLSMNEDHTLYAKWEELTVKRWLSYDDIPYMTGRLDNDEIVIQDQEGFPVNSNSEALPILKRAKEILDDAQHSPQYSNSTFGGTPDTRIQWLKGRINTFIVWDSFAYSVNIVVPFIEKNAYKIFSMDPKVIANALEHFANTYLDHYTNPDIFLNSWAGDLLQEAMTSCDEFIAISENIRDAWHQDTIAIASEDVLIGYWDYVFVESVTQPLMDFVLNMRTTYFYDQLGEFIQNLGLYSVQNEDIRKMIVLGIEEMKTVGREVYSIAYMKQGFQRAYGQYYDQIPAFRICIDEINRNRVYYSPYVEDWLPIEKLAKFTVLLDLGYGEEPIKQSIMLYEGDCYGPTLRVPPEPRPGYSFEGWYTAPNGQGIRVDADTVLSIMVDHTLYANWKDLQVGDIGPSGGYVFYDKGHYSDGWRFMEAAPAGWNGSEEDPGYLFGYYVGYVESGRYWWNVQVGTGGGIGNGKTNTEALVAAMGSAACTLSMSNSQPYTTTSQYAAKVCADYRGKGYDNWFLPSRIELIQMYENLKRNNLGGFSNDYYWSSTELDPYNAYKKAFSDGSMIYHPRYITCKVRPVRAF